MPSPKSPLDKPSHSRRPSNSRRTSSDKSVPKSSSVNKHGVKVGHSLGRSKDSMLETIAGAEAPPSSDGPENKQGRQSQQTLAGAPSKVGVEEDADAKGVSVDVSHGVGLGKGYKAGEVPEISTPEEVERLKAAMNAQIQLNQHREKLAKQLGERGDGRGPNALISAAGKARVSPISEEISAMSPSLDAAFASLLPSGLETASTESIKTVRGGNTPAAVSARTPSYPFPPMRTPGLLSHGESGHRPFTTLSPTVNPSNYAWGTFAGNPHDRVLSGSVTPASTLNFQPAGVSETQADQIFAAPNLYDLSLMLSAEPGLDPWWTTVVQLMKEIYKAERVTLSVPADSTDIENVPWGQKATFNANEGDELSLNYLQRGSSLVPSSVGTMDTSNSDADDSPPIGMPSLHVARPNLLSRHSFTSFEDSRSSPGSGQGLPVRPTPLVRAQSYLSTAPRDQLPPRAGTLQNAQLNLQSLQDHMDFEDANPSDAWENAGAATRNVQGRVFSVLQALDYEADPLIDSTGVLRVLDRGKVIALTRDYPYLDNPDDEKSGETKTPERSSRLKQSPVDKVNKGKAPELVSRISTILGNKTSRRSSRSLHNQTSEKGKSIPMAAREYDEPPINSYRYEEYEQTPPSPWAQSPAPSPAVRSETGDNPFFANSPPVDEETFNPETNPQDYTKMQPLEAIGIDRSWTVLHIPLTHPLLSRPVQSFRLDAAVIESRSASRGKKGEQLPKYPDAKPQEQARDKRTPIAILSILTPVIPYPSNLRNSLEQLAPHLATSFSLCRHYSNLENEIAGLSRKRPQTTGFGAVAPGARNGKHSGTFLYSPTDETGPRQSTGGSITSPSEYSGRSRSTAGSPADTPGWGIGSSGLSMDKRSSGGNLPYGAHGESYFSSKATRPSVTRADTGLSITSTRRTSSKDNSPADTRFKLLPRSSDDDVSNHDAISATERDDDGHRGEMEHDDHASSTSTPRQESRARADLPPAESSLEASETRDTSPSQKKNENPWSPRRQAMRSDLLTGTPQQGTSKSERPHTQLHSYGADFGATFQSLPATSASSSRFSNTTKMNSRSGSLSVPVDMPPPSDRLKGLMLDSLPAHVFVALPQTGEIVWVNNRYLTYRGQTVPELYEDPWGSIHPDEREEYLKAWSHAIKTGEQFSMQVRIRRFDGTYRWFYTRAVGSRDIRGVIVQWYGSHMDIHDQHIAEVKAARQEEIEASEAKHRQLANLIPQIIFAATEDEGVTFANEQWLSYTGQDFNDALGLGFMDYIHPEDLAKCHIPTDSPPTPSHPRSKKAQTPARNSSHSSSGGNSISYSDTPTETTVKGVHQSLSRNNSSSSSSVYELPSADLSELARTGVIKVSTDADGRLSYTTEVRLKSKTGEYRWHLVRCVEVDNINLGSGDGSWFGACTDINDHKLLETKLKEAMESKGKFLSNMSHEIRTPLIGISGMVNFLQDTVLNDEQMDYTNTISSSATSLLNIINDILDLSKVDAGMMKLSYEWFHTRSLVEEVNEMVSTLAITKRLELNYVVDVDVPEMVKGDKFRIRQVLLNVIGNAIKFTTVGEVFTRCRVIASESANVGPNEVRLEFSVIDTGRGFTQQEAEMIFKPFSQIDGSSTRQHGGSGLGLVISRQLVELHGGKMEGSAVPNQGSTFTFTAVFGMPTPEDHPEPLQIPALVKATSGRTSIIRSSSITNEVSIRAMRQAGGNPILANKFMQSPLADSPGTMSSVDSPTVLSSASSDPSVHSARSNTRSSASSIAQSLLNFSEAARASQPDLSQMKLALPEKVTSPSSPDASSTAPVDTLTKATPTLELASTHGETLSRTPSTSSHELKHTLLEMYSILVLCPQKHSREATTQHIEITLPKDIPYQITPLSSVAEAQEMIGGEDPVRFTHIVLNLPNAEDLVMLIEQILTSASLPDASIVVLSDPVQRQEVVKMASEYDYDQLAKDMRVRFIYKPVKPSRFAVIFDPEKERDLSTDRNRSNAQQLVANQKQNYADVGKRLGNKGLKVLLVEDNVVNQKVLLKFLSKVGIAVELALDGMECTEKVFSHPHPFYSLILVNVPFQVSNLQLTLYSAIFICLAKTATKPAAKSANGRPRTLSHVCQSSLYQQT
jgi:nitrogen-specific signal transduction histidine kinase